MVATRSRQQPARPEPHPLLAAFPRMGADEFEAFKADVAAHGQREPGRTFRGLLIDGRERRRACEELLVEFASEEWAGRESDLAAFVVSLNLQRRHYSESQRAMIAARLATARRGDNQHRPGAGRAGSAGRAVPPIGGTSQRQAATLLNVGTRSVERAQAVIDRGVPELVAEVEADRMSVSSAAAIAQLPAATQREIVADRPAAAEPAPRLPRLATDPDRYIRRVKGGRYQARPFDGTQGGGTGGRDNLGLFPTRGAARAAILEYWQGRRPGLPRYVKAIHGRAGTKYLACVPVRLGEFATRDAAAAAVETWVRATFSAAAADELLGRKGTG